MEKQQEQIDQAQRDAEQRSFEDAYFRMLTVLNQIIDSMDLQGPKGVTKGRDVFGVFRDRLIHAHKGDYIEFYERVGQDLGHYYRMLYNILDFIRMSESRNQNLYVKILRAQLSDAEVQLLFYNSISDYGSEKMKPLVEYFTMLKHFRPTERLEQEIHLAKQYHPIAFKRDATWPAWVVG